jgi:hypothetical protein
VDASHTGACCITCPKGGFGLWSKFSDAGWTCTKVMGKPAKIIKEAVYCCCEFKPTLDGGVTKDFLQGAEETAAARQCKEHGSQLANYFVPTFGRDAAASRGYFCQQFVKPVEAMGRQFDGKVHRVNDPAQNNFACGPCRLAFAEFFYGDWFLAKAGISGIQGAKNAVHGMKQNLADCAEASRGALGKGDKIIDVDVMGGQGF